MLGDWQHQGHLQCEWTVALLVLVQRLALHNQQSINPFTFLVFRTHQGSQQTMTGNAMGDTSHLVLLCNTHTVIQADQVIRTAFSEQAGIQFSEYRKTEDPPC